MTEPTDPNQAHIGGLSTRTIEYYVLLGSSAYALKRLAEGGKDPVKSEGRIIPRFKDPKDTALTMPAGLAISGFIGHVLAWIFMAGSVLLLVPWAIMDNNHNHWADQSAYYRLPDPDPVWLLVIVGIITLIAWFFFIRMIWRFIWRRI